MSVRSHVRSSLAEDEQVIHEQGPDARVWLLEQIPEAFIAGVCLVIVVAASSTPVTVIGLVGVTSIIANVAAGYLQRRSTRYVITQYRVIRFSGVFRRDHEWMSWKKVTDVSVRRSLIDRWAHTATIKIQSANEASGFAAMNDLARPLEFAQTVVDLVNASQGKVPIVVRNY